MKKRIKLGGLKPRKKVSWQEQEADAVTRVPGGKPTRGSGNSTMTSRKGDVIGKTFRMECKTVDDSAKKSFSVKRADIDKIKHEALSNGQVPAYMFGWPGSPREDWIAFPASSAQRLMEIVEALKRGDTVSANEALELL